MTDCPTAGCARGLMCSALTSSRPERDAERQRQAAEGKRQEDDAFQELLTIIAAVLLMPTLVATIYGANVALPGRDTFEGLLAMLMLMVVSAALATVVAVGLLRRRKRAGRRRGEAEEASAELPSNARNESRA